VCACGGLYKQPSERGATELKATLLQRFAAQYVALSVPYGHQLHRPTRPSDQYMALFNTALAEATVRGFSPLYCSRLDLSWASTDEPV